MCLFVLDDGADRAERVGIALAKIAQLRIEVSEYDPFHCDRRGTDRWPTAQAGNKTEKETADATQMIAPATLESAPAQLSGKNRTMPLLMALKIGELVAKLGAAPPARQRLAPINIDGAVFTGVVHL
jgi:hypothetical protein